MQAKILYFPFPSIIQIRVPIVRWAQRKDRVFLTIELRDIKNEKIDLQSTHLNFSGQSDKHQYEFQLNFFEDVLVEESKWNLIGLDMQFILIKKNPEGTYWKRLTKEEKKFQYIQVDWSKYVDEDDEQEEGGKGLQDWDQDKFQDFDGGRGQGEGAGEGDEDDEEDDGDFNKGNVDDLEEELDIGNQGEQVQKSEQVEQTQEKQE